MSEILFISKFLALTIIYIALVALGKFTLSNFGERPCSLRDAVASTLGTHIGRLRVLLFGILASFVLSMLYPGPPLLLPEGSVDTIREFGHHILYGSSEPFVPAAPDHSTWFWGQAALVYLGILALYVVLALPTVLAEAVRAVHGVLNTSGDAKKPFMALLWAIVGAFVAVFAMRLAGERAKP